MVSIILIVYAVLYITGSAILFRGISGFKTRLRRAYIIVLIGILMEATVHTGEALAQLFDWWAKSWFDNTQKVFYILAPVLIYLGVRSFGRLLQIKSVSTYFSLTFVSGIVIAVIIGYLKGPTSQGPIDFQVGFTGMLVWLLMMAAWTLVQIWHQTSQLYKQSVYWLAWAIGLLAIATGAFLVRQFVGGDIMTLVMITLFVVSGLALCQAAREFYAIRGKNLGELKKADSISNSIDIVVYAASLVSNPRDIDPLLDKLRTITAATDRKHLSQTEEENLRQLYLQLEDYLTARDPIRTYERSMIRELISRKLADTKTTANTFWPQLT